MTTATKKIPGIAHDPKRSAAALDSVCINTLRFLSVDAVQKANSGHPGMPMGAAAMVYTLWTRFLNVSPAQPSWFNRDRFVLSAGHGSMLLYSLLHVCGFDVSIEDIRRFRRRGSITAGHPEYGLTPGVDVTTGPLGQGFANGVGMAIAEANLAARYNRPGLDIVSHYTYGVVSDGDLMEGVSAEAASLAGHLRLGKLVYLYDDNRITLSAATSLTFSEDCILRFESYGWHTQEVEDGNKVEDLARAIARARAETMRPSIIRVRTHIGFGSPHKQDTVEAHGAPLGEDEVKLTKTALGWPLDPPFYVPEAAYEHFRECMVRGKQAEADWRTLLEEYRKKYPDLAEEFRLQTGGQLPSGWDREVPAFPADAKGMATRVASGKVLNAIAGRVHAIAGGSADLDPSTFTALSNAGDFENGGSGYLDRQGSAGGGWSRAGRNIHFGVREHAMGAILNGMAVHGGTIPFGATFLIFSDYVRPPVRLAAIMRQQVIYVFTHDSIGLGEDGTTHQPVEQLAGLRAVPGLLVIRPADANETAVAWKVAMETRDRPTALILTRQNVPTLDRSVYAPAESLRRGGYILIDAPNGRPDAIIIASGSEVSLACEAAVLLAQRGVRVRVVSMPSWELFDAQPREYRDEVLDPLVGLRLAVEAGSPLGWHKYTGDRGDTLGITSFGSSAPGAELMAELGFTKENIADRVLGLVAGRISREVL